ncbi:MAG TPA: DUF2721 domain-containing protein [Stellaceae bacterium]|nr:DUF2721 domain-containing protein [Stellaceae bacterium]
MNAVLASAALGDAVHMIQVALTPVFLLNGVATLLNVFSSRLARVADRVNAAARQLEVADATTAAALSAQLEHLRKRSHVLDAAVALGAAGGAMTCLTVLALFIGEAGGFAVAAVLFITFGLAIGCTLVAIGAYATEMMMASRGVRAEVAFGQQLAESE